jgi:hypothetical protein
MGTRRSDTGMDGRRDSWGGPPPSPFTYPPTVSGSSSSFGGQPEGTGYNGAAGSGTQSGGQAQGTGPKRQRRESSESVMFGMAEEVGGDSR